MNRLIAVVLSLFLLSLPASALTCESNTTEKEFFTHVYQRGWTVYTLTDKGNEKLLKWVNTVRAKEGVSLFKKGTKLYFANTKVNTTGLVYMFEGCVVLCCM